MGRAKGTDSFSEVIGKRGALPHKLFSANKGISQLELERLLLQYTSDPESVFYFIFQYRKDQTKQEHLKQLTQGIADKLFNNRETEGEWSDQLACFGFRQLPIDYKRKLQQAANLLAQQMLGIDSQLTSEILERRQKSILREITGEEIAWACIQNPHMLMVMIPDRYDDFVASLSRNGSDIKYLKDFTFKQWQFIGKLVVGMADFDAAYDENPDISRQAMAALQRSLEKSVASTLVQNLKLSDEALYEDTNKTP